MPQEPPRSTRFAVASLRRWWGRWARVAPPRLGSCSSPPMRAVHNGYRSRVWKHEPQQLADETRMCIHVSHFPPGTSKWNKIEHRVFCHSTQNWRGKPLRTFETIVDLIGTYLKIALWDEKGCKTPGRRPREGIARRPRRTGMVECDGLRRARR